MSRQINLADAKARFSELVDAASRGEEIVLARRGRPVARIVAPGAQGTAKPRIGAMRDRLSEADIEALANLIEAPLKKRDAAIAAGALTDDLGLTRRRRLKRARRSPR
jgi:prevent-host-death family protein